eukprot:Skav220137  [mRNA]  locus=scaffold1320:42612:47876:- [translate_table: standard]
MPASHLELRHVYGHQMDPWNELADALAAQATLATESLSGLKDVAVTPWFSLVPHLWFLIGAHADLPLASSSSLLIPPPSPPPTVSIADSEVRPSGCQPDDCHVSLALGSANFMSLYYSGEGHKGKVQYLDSQFAELGLHLIGLQEARTPAGTSHSPNFIRFASGKTPQGTHGVELWLRKSTPGGHVNGRPWYFEQHQVCVIHASPTCLLARLSHPHLSFWVLVAHAPTSSSEEAYAQEWLESLQALMATHVKLDRCCVLIDANAPLGSRDDMCVFEVDDLPGPTSHHLRSFMSDSELCAPISLPTFGPWASTWTSPDGLTEKRIDHVLVPQSMLAAATWAGTVSDVDLSICDHDHKFTGVQLDFILPCAQFSSQPPATFATCKFDRRSIAGNQQLQARLITQSIPAWEVDIESHVESFNHQCREALSYSCKKVRRPPVKAFISDETWQQRHVCRRLKARLHRARKTNSSLLPEVLDSLRQEYRAECAKFRNLLRYDKDAGLRQTLDSVTSSTTSSELLRLLKPFRISSNQKFWGRCPLPHVLDDDGRPCQDSSALLDAWISHFSRMEGGTRMSLQDYRLAWAEASGRALTVHDTDSLSVLPSLAQLEQAFHHVANGKATGQDGVPSDLCHSFPTTLARQCYSQLLKLVTYNQEAPCHKGGRLAIAWKQKGPQNVRESFRSLLVSSHVGKTLHRALRQHQNHLYRGWMQNQQLGGRAKTPVSLASHLTRAYHRVQLNRSRSVGIVFLDLRKAFYRVIRPLAVGGSMTDEQIAQVAARLRLPDSCLADLHELLCRPAAVSLAGYSSMQQRTLQTLHSFTWFNLSHQSDVVCTTQGSRPSDGFADIVFGFLWSRVLQSVESSLVAIGALDFFTDASHPGLDFAPGAVQRPFLGPTWMDDLSLCVSAESHDLLESRVAQSASVLLDECYRHGMTPNVSAGKTEVMFSFVGRGASSARARYFGPTASGKLTVLGEHQSYSLTVTKEYRHLGGMIHYGGGCIAEIRRRFGIAHAAYSDHAKLIFRNRSLSFVQRKQAFVTLILSKLTYAMETWVFHGQKDLESFRKSLFRLYKRFVGYRHDQHLSRLQILADSQLPDLDLLLKRARLRYLATLFASADLHVWGVLQQDSAWLSQVRDDLDWLWSFVRDTSSLPDPRSDLSPWYAVMQGRKGYWKKLINRAVDLNAAQTASLFDVAQCHSSVAQDAVSLKPALQPHLLPTEVSDFAGHFGCLICQKTFKSKAGEAAHMFRVHQQCAPERYLFQGTQCQVCLKEYYSHDRLQRHLKYSEPCRTALLASLNRFSPVPGIGSSVTVSLRQQHDGLRPVFQAAGPQTQDHYDPRVPPLPRQHVELEAFFSHMLIQWSDEDSESLTLLDFMLSRLLTLPVSWTHLVAHVNDFSSRVSDEDASLLGMDLPGLQQTLIELLDPSMWTFLSESPQQPSVRADSVETWESRFRVASEIAASACLRIPRQQGRHRFLLHAFAGRRRRGDVEFFMNKLPAINGVVIHIVSVDILHDRAWGDVARAETKRFWYAAADAGFVVAFLAGPPCESWSKARFNQDIGQNRRLPRPIRAIQTLWGKQSVSLREQSQLTLGNTLLCFSICMMSKLDRRNNHGMVEHPAEPDEGHFPSIWRLALVQWLLLQPGHSRVRINQGYYGAKSAKPTDLWCLNLDGFETALRQGRLSQQLPSFSSIGKSDKGHWLTSTLKEYPPGLCRIIAEQMHSQMSSEAIDDSIQISQEFWERSATMRTSFTDFIGPDFAPG